MKGYQKYFGLTNYADGSFRLVNDYMLSRGWRMTDPEDADLTLQEINEMNMVRGFNYAGADGLTASVGFAPRNAPWNCNGDSLCKMTHSSAAQKYAGLVAVTVEYDQTPY